MRQMWLRLVLKHPSYLASAPTYTKHGFAAGERTERPCVLRYTQSSRTPLMSSRPKLYPTRGKNPSRPLNSYLDDELCHATNTGQ